jgi:hypothetical protein
MSALGNALLHEIRTADDLKTERDYLQTWLEISVEGVRIEKSARAGLGEDYLEDFHPVYEYNNNSDSADELSPWWILFSAGPEEKAALTEEGLIKSGLLFQTHERRHSPYLVRRVDDRLILEKQGEYLQEIQYLPRPRYLNEKTSDGIPAGNLVVPIGSYWLECAPFKGCYYFAKGEQCRYCNITYNSKQPDARLVRKNAEQIAEAFAIAWDSAPHYQGMSMCGGSLPGSKDQLQYIRIAKAIRELRSNWDDADDDSLPLDYLGGAPIPGELARIDQLKEAGFRYIQLNQEIGDPAWFAAVCPGKQRAITHEGWVEALRYAARVFGPNGRVRSGFVSGLEPVDSLIAAIQDHVSHDVLGYAVPWRPTPGSLFEGHRAPEPNWFLALYDRLSALYLESDLDIWKVVGNRSMRFFEYSPGFQFWRAKQGIKSAETWAYGRL